MNLRLEIIDQFLCYQFLTEYLKNWFIKDLLSLLINILIHYIHHNMDSAVDSTQQATLEILNDILLILMKANSLFVYLLT